MWGKWLWVRWLVSVVAGVVAYFAGRRGGGREGEGGELTPVADAAVGGVVAGEEGRARYKTHYAGAASDVIRCIEVPGTPRSGRITTVNYHFDKKTDQYKPNVPEGMEGGVLFMILSNIKIAMVGLIVLRCGGIKLRER